MLKEMDMEVKVVDIWTEYGRFPWNKMAAGYPFCCKYPAIWKSMYYTTIGLEVPTDILWRVQCGSGFKRCIGGFDPDMVVSLHPLCQNLPLKVMETIAKEKGRDPDELEVRDGAEQPAAWRGEGAHASAGLSAARGGPLEAALRPSAAAEARRSGGARERPGRGATQGRRGAGGRGSGLPPAAGARCRG